MGTHWFISHSTLPLLLSSKTFPLHYTHNTHWYPWEPGVGKEHHVASCKGENLCLLLNTACHLAAGQSNIHITIHGVLDIPLSSVNSRLFKRSKFNLKKKEIIILKKAQNTEYRTVEHSTIQRWSQTLYSSRHRHLNGSCHLHRTRGSLAMFRAPWFTPTNSYKNAKHRYWPYFSFEESATYVNQQS